MTVPAVSAAAVSTISVAICRRLYCSQYNKNSHYVFYSLDDHSGVAKFFTSHNFFRALPFTAQSMQKYRGNIHKYTI